MQSVRLFTLFLWQLVAVLYFFFDLKRLVELPEHHCKESFASQIVFITLYLSWPAFFPPVSPNTRYLSLFSLYSHLFHNLSVRTKRLASQPALWCQAIREHLHVWKNKCSTVWLSLSLGRNLSAVNNIIWIQNTDTFLLSPSWYFVGCGLIYTITSSGRPFWRSHTSV